MEFGKEAKLEFTRDPSISFLNHGSFGGYPKVVFNKRLELLHEQDRDPDTWFSSKVSKLYQESVDKLADFLHAKPENIAITDNATTGTNTILKSMRFEPGDKVLVTKHAYGAVTCNTREYVDYNGVEQIVFPLTFPIKSEDELVESLNNFLSDKTGIVLAILDHITSSSGIVLPISRMAEICKDRNILVAVDGAHAPGQLELYLEDLNIDFYTANLHKWMYTPLSCGFLWVHEKHHRIIRPPITSHNYNTNLQEAFKHPGTRDLTAFYTIPTALKFYQDIGGLDKITTYNKNLLKWAENYFQERLKLTPLEIPESMRAPGLLVLKLPDKVIDVEAKLKNRDQWISTVQFEAYKVVTLFSAFDSRAWVRLSANVYNCKEDFVRLAGALENFFIDPTVASMKGW